MREVGDYVREVIFLVEEALPKGVSEVERALADFQKQYRKLIDN